MVLADVGELRFFYPLIFTNVRLCCLSVISIDSSQEISPGKKEGGGGGGEGHVTAYSGITPTITWEYNSAVV